MNITFLKGQDVGSVYYVVKHPTEGIIAMLNINLMSADFVSNLSAELKQYAMDELSSKYPGLSYDKQS